MTAPTKGECDGSCAGDEQGDCSHVPPLPAATLNVEAMERLCDAATKHIRNATYDHTAGYVKQLCTLVLQLLAEVKLLREEREERANRWDARRLELEKRAEEVEALVGVATGALDSAAGVLEEFAGLGNDFVTKTMNAAAVNARAAARRLAKGE